MINKKTLVITVLVLLLSQQSFANGTGGFYLSGGYYGIGSMTRLKLQQLEKPSFTMHFNFQDDNNKSVNRKNLKRSDQSNELQPKYSPFFAANMAFGYSINSYRVELEGIYSVMTANNRGFESGGKISWNTRPTVVSTKSKSIMANIYRHWKSDRFSLSPYVGTGIGAINMKVLSESSIWFAYQLKAGVDYQIHKYVSMRTGYRYFGATTITKIVLQTPFSTEGNLNLDGVFSIHGIEIGLNLHFASKTSSIV